MRARLLSPKAVRHIGIALNGGRIHGWVDRVAALMDSPPMTVRSWATPPSSSAARSINGPASNLLLVYAVMMDRGASLDVMAQLVDAKYEAITKAMEDA
jgi:hypothetical protein